MASPLSPGSWRQRDGQIAMKIRWSLLNWLLLSETLSCTRRFGGSGRAKSSRPCGICHSLESDAQAWQHAKICDIPSPVVDAVFYCIHSLNGMEIGDRPWYPLFTCRDGSGLFATLAHLWCLCFSDPKPSQPFTPGPFSITAPGIKCRYPRLETQFWEPRTSTMSFHSQNVLFAFYVAPSSMKFWWRSICKGCILEP